jgi:hypothetical protein
MTLPENIEELVSQYVKLRDTIKKADEAHKKKLEEPKGYLKQLEGKLLERLNDVGGESVKTASGTVYRTARRSATIADGEAFRNFVIGHDAWDIADLRANAPAVEDFIEAEGSTPPGVNFNKAYTVGVRRS